MADSPAMLPAGLATGFLFGFFLHKGQVTKFPVIVGQFLFRDFTVMKVMLTAIVVGGAGVYAFRAAGLATLHVKPAQMAAVIAGGAVFGVGMALLGYCPGTGVAAAAEGKRDAWSGVLGMLAGAAIYAEVFPLLRDNVLAWANYGELTLPAATGVPAWAWFAALGAAAVLVFRAVSRLEARGS